MDSNRDLKLKSPLEEYYGKDLKDAYSNGQNQKIINYRAILLRYKEHYDAVLEYHKEELKVYRLSGKLQLMDDLFIDGVMDEVKEKLERELELAQCALQDVKVPHMNWEKLGEPLMWR